MSMSVACTDCGKQYAVGPAMAGRRVKCKKCGNVFRVPHAAPEPEPAYDAAGAYDDARPSFAGEASADPFAAGGYDDDGAGAGGGGGDVFSAMAALEQTGTPEPDAPVVPWTPPKAAKR